MTEGAAKKKLVIIKIDNGQRFPVSLPSQRRVIRDRRGATAKEGAKPSPEPLPERLRFPLPG